MWTERAVERGSPWMPLYWDCPGHVPPASRHSRPLTGGGFRVRDRLVAAGWVPRPGLGGAPRLPGRKRPRSSRGLTSSPRCPLRPVAGRLPPGRPGCRCCMLELSPPRLRGAFPSTLIILNPQRSCDEPAMWKRSPPFYRCKGSGFRQPQ